YYTPQFEVSADEASRQYVGWDGVTAEYVNPPASNIIKPIDVEDYLPEWEELKNSKQSVLRN
ncbi:MAG: KamA family radical SAM protein, partial [Bdellovibrionaceae bacterium]|nr:KamA family radical SAM protein [Pseudobdellovibrionaceae bacterium]